MSEQNPTIPALAGTVGAVKAVFYVQEVTFTANGQGRIKATPVAKGPYAEYSKYTPSGLLEFTCLNEAATQFFMDRRGKDVALIIRPATADDILQPDPVTEPDRQPQVR